MKESRPIKRKKYCPVFPPNLAPLLERKSNKPIWSWIGQFAKNFPKLPCSIATSTTNCAFFLTEEIFCALRMIRSSELKSSQNRLDCSSNFAGSNLKNASSNPGHLFSTTFQTKPAEKTRFVISLRIRSSGILLSLFLGVTLGRRVCNTFSPPFLLAARFRIFSKEIIQDLSIYEIRLSKEKI